MSNSNTNNAPALSPPVVIVVCIAGAVVLVIIFAAVYRLCRTVHANANDDLEGGQWNPNRREPAQVKYCQEVRWRNNASVWQSVNQDHCKRGWYWDLLEEQSTQAPVTLQNNGLSSSLAAPYDSAEISAEEFLTLHKDNPYQELVDKRQQEMYDQQKRQSKSVAIEERPAIQLNDHFLLSPKAHPVQLKAEADNYNPSRGLIDHEGDEETKDVFDAVPSGNELFPPRQSRMFRSSSIYSGDGLLPSNHLHMVQSSSSYGLGGFERNT